MIKQYGSIEAAEEAIVCCHLAEENETIWSVYIDISNQTQLIGDNYNAPDIRALDTIQRLYGLTDNQIRRLWVLWSEISRIKTRKNVEKRKVAEAKARMNRGRS